MKTEYIELLNSYVFSIWRFLLLPIVLIVILTIIIFIKKRHSNKTFYKSFIICMFVFCGLITIGCVNTIPAIIDINSDKVITAEFKTAYYYNQSYLNDQSMLGLNPILVVKPDGTQIECQDLTFKFPYEVNDGVIIYAPHSRIILDYSGEVIKENHF